MQVNFMDPNSQPLQAPVMPTQNQGMAQVQMPGQPQKQGGMQFSPEQLSKIAEMLKGGVGSAPGGMMPGIGQGMAMGAGQGMMPSLPMAGGMMGGFGGGMPMGGG